MMRIAMIVLVAFSLTGCASVRLTRLAEIDANEKTISMSAGGGWLTGELKAALLKDGWKVYAVDKAKEIVQGVDDPTAEDKRVVVYRESELVRTARYHLIDHWSGGVRHDIYRWTRYDDYDVSLVDNKTGQEVLILSGQHKRGYEIVKIFIDAIHGVEYDGWDREQ